MNQEHFNSRPNHNSITSKSFISHLSSKVGKHLLVLFSQGWLWLRRQSPSSLAPPVCVLKHSCARCYSLNCSRLLCHQCVSAFKLSSRWHLVLQLRPTVNEYDMKCFEWSDDWRGATQVQVHFSFFCFIFGGPTYSISYSVALGQFLSQLKMSLLESEFLYY